jgi:hypothetical protein
MFMATWFTYDVRGVISTIPFIIIIAFILRLFYEKGAFIVGTAFFSSFFIASIKDNFGYGVFMIIGIVFATFAAVILAKGIRHPQKNQKIVLSIIGFLLVILAGGNYAETWGTPLGYLGAKSNIERYIDENYEGRLQIESIKRIFLKMSGYEATVVQIDDRRNKSTIYYGNHDYISDDYHWQTTENMMEQVQTVLITLIENQTDLTDYAINLKSDMSIPIAKYNLNDRFSGEEPVNVEIQLQPGYSWKEKKGQDSVPKVYKNEEAFLEDAYKVIAVLQNVGYQYANIRVYYYLEDGNTTYEIVLQDNETISTVQELTNRVQKVNHAK